jgi:hypothetical protein
MSTVAESAEIRRQDVAVKIDADVARLAKIVASFEGLSMARYLSSLLRPIVEAAYDAQIKAAKPRLGRKPPRR